jgi:hypothetical protein
MARGAAPGPPDWRGGGRRAPAAPCARGACGRTAGAGPRLGRCGERPGTRGRGGGRAGVAPAGGPRRESWRAPGQRPARQVWCHSPPPDRAPRPAPRPTFLEIAPFATLRRAPRDHARRAIAGHASSMGGEPGDGAVGAASPLRPCKIVASIEAPSTGSCASAQLPWSPGAGMIRARRPAHARAPPASLLDLLAAGPATAAAPPSAQAPAGAGARAPTARRLFGGAAPAELDAWLTQAERQQVRARRGGG